jgi:hypothetical protein
VKYLQFKYERLIIEVILLGLLSFAGIGRVSAQIESLAAYISAPGVQSSSQAGNSGAETETFDSLPQGNETTPYASSIGTFQFSTTAQGAILAADQYGGANGTQYMAFGAQSGTSAPITINLNGSYNYFGFWFSAGDSNNGITFYSNGTEFARFSTANILSLLSGSTVTALNGSTYNSSAYYGNPNGTNEDSGEPFTYVEIVTTGTTFDTVVLDNSGTTATGFESDNDTVYFGSVAVPTSDVFVSILTVVPEPSHYTMLLGAVILFLVGARSLMVGTWQRSLEVAKLVGSGGPST